MRYVTIKDIAAKLGISKSTVSRALAGDGNVSAETRHRVQETADLLGYKRNELAANLRHNETGTIGILVPEMLTPFFLSVIISAQKTLNERGFKVMMTQSNENAEAELNNLRMMENYRVDGIIMSICDKERNVEEYKRLVAKDIPIVFFDRVPPAMNAPKVIVDDYLKSFFMVEYLVRSGCRHILHIAGPDRIPNAFERRRAYRDVLEKFRIPYRPELVKNGENERSDGARVIADIMARGIEFDAIFCFGETQAIGVQNYLLNKGVKIPEQVSICCFSGTDLGTIVSPQLTVIQQPFEEMGRVSAEMMIERLNDPEAPCRTVVLDAEMIVRQST